MRLVGRAAVVAGLGALGCSSSSAKVDVSTADAGVIGGDRSSATVDTSTCPYTLHPSQVLGSTVRCGFVDVPEDRALPSGRRVRLAFALFNPTILSDARPATALLQGGPGQGWTESAPAISVASTEGEPLLILDQRGTGSSLPSLQCAGYDFALEAHLYPDVEAARTTALAALGACRTKLEESAALSAYTTEAMAHDLADVASVLGTGPLVLDGTSFGTRWALATAQRHPEVVKALVLDSVTSTSIPGFSNLASGAWQAIEATLAACDGTAACKAAYGPLNTRLLSALAKLETTPAAWSKGPGGRFTSSQLVAATLALAASAPQSLPAQLKGLLDALDAGAAPSLDILPAMNQSELLGLLVGSNDASNNQGQWLSVTCHDNQDVSQPAIDADLAKLPAEVKPVAARQLATYQAYCAAWKVAPRDVSSGEAPSFSTPALLLSGTFDPSTPRSWALTLAQGLKNARRVEFPTGHSVRGQPVAMCARSVVASFLKGGPVDDACAKAEAIAFD